MNYSQTEKDRYYMVSHIWAIKKKKKANFAETENRMVVAKSWEEGEMDDVAQRVHIFS